MLHGTNVLFPLGRIGDYVVPNKLRDVGRRLLGWPLGRYRICPTCESVSPRPNLRLEDYQVRRSRVARLSFVGLRRGLSRHVVTRFR
jgi:hypothetical protein